MPTATIDICIWLDLRYSYTTSSALCAMFSSNCDGGRNARNIYRLVCLL